MGRRGPPAKPLALLKQSGSWRANINKNAPEPTEGVPQKPTFMSEEAQGYWDALVPLLLDMGLLTMADGDSLALYCQSLARLAECERVINEEGLTYTQYAEDGSIRMIRARPEQRMAKELYTIVSRLGKEFGLSPSSRAHLNVADANAKMEVNEKAKFFGT
jgi:P27 family predicted phage terminase small subunit